MDVKESLIKAGMLSRPKSEDEIIAELQGEAFVTLANVKMALHDLKLKIHNNPAKERFRYADTLVSQVLKEVDNAEQKFMNVKKFITDGERFKAMMVAADSVLSPEVNKELKDFALRLLDEERDVDVITGEEFDMATC